MGEKLVGENVYIGKNVLRLICLCKDYVGFFFFDKFIYFGWLVLFRY